MRYSVTLTTGEEFKASQEGFDALTSAALTGKTFWKHEGNYYSLRHVVKVEPWPDWTEEDGIEAYFKAKYPGKLDSQPGKPQD